MTNGQVAYKIWIHWAKVICTVGNIEWDKHMIFLCNTHSKTYGLFVPGIFHAVFSDHNFPQETEALEHETMEC